MAATFLPSLPAVAEKSTEKYPYVMFAASYQDDAIIINADNFCVNGSIATNGTIVSSGNLNVNGTKTENADEEMIYIFDKINSTYFSGNNVDEYPEDYALEEMNININDPLEIEGNATLTGNININTALKVLEDVTLNGEVKNTSNSVIYSKYGDIVIDSQNANLNGLIYAPFGDVEITAQNLTLNNVVIIADTITFNCPSVNANYSESMAEFTGTISEPLNIPYEEWRYMKDENLNDFPDFFEDFDNWSKMLDTDSDGLPDSIETDIGSNPEMIDSDGDGLDDYYEVFVTYTSPIKPDSDNNGINDAEDDLDKDGLTNYEEYIIGTDPWEADSDEDTLTDGDEINTYGTDPLKKDTDDDGLEDGDEIYLETDAINPDTDGNGILDGDEKFYQTFTHIVENEDCAVEEVIVSMWGTGNLQKTTTVDSIMNKDILCTDVVGLVGEPFEIKTESQFDKATITFKVNQSKLENASLDDLLFLWYDEANDEFVELETVYDTENSTVSIETTHFSKYMLVDQKEWFEAWKNAPDYFDSGEYVPFDTVICIDCSGSMSSNDPYFTYYYTPTHQLSSARTVNYRTLAVEQYIESMRTGDKTAIINYESSAYLKCGLTSSKSTLKSALSPYNGGGTNAKVAVEKAFDLLNSQTDENNKSIILLSDGDVNLNVDNIRAARADEIKIYTVGLGSGANSTSLENIAKDTGGTFYVAKTAEELENIYNDISWEQFQQIEWEDNDEDGIPDEFEASGLICSNGKIYYTEYQDIETGQDTDGDGLNDGQEILIEYGKSHIPYNHSSHAEFKSAVYFTYRSNPILADTDGDGYNDDIDPEPDYLTVIKPLGTDNYLSDVKLMAQDVNGVYSYSAKTFLGDYTFYKIHGKKLEAEYAIDIMMDDVNKCPSTDLVPYDDWLNFCLYFNECVQTYGTVDKTLHYFRNKLNRAPATLAEMLEILEEDNTSWILCTARKARYHMYGIDGEYNIKFVSSTDDTNNMFEAVYSLKNIYIDENTGELIADNCILITEEINAENMGTYNYYGTEMKDPKKLHSKFDVKTFEKYGNVSWIPYVDDSEEANWSNYNNNADAQNKYNLLCEAIK